MASLKNKSDANCLHEHVCDCLPSKFFHNVAKSLGEDWKILGRELNIDDADLQHIESEYKSGGLYEMAYQMLRMWKQRERKKANLLPLQKHLEAIGRNDLVEPISQKPKSLFYVNAGSEEISDGNTVVPNSDLLTEVKDIFIKEYLQLEMKGLTWMQDIKIPFDEYCVDLNLIDVPGTRGKHPSKPINIKEMFTLADSKRKCSRILVEGGPGMGKSTLAFKLASDWARKKQYIKDFDLVMVFQLRYFVSDLKDMICNFVYIPEKYHENVLRIFEDQSKNILFILDGYDELAPTNEADIRLMIQGQLYSHVTMIVTSRPDMCTALKTDESKRDVNLDFSPACSYVEQRHIIVDGFTSTQQKQFVKKHTKSCPEKVKQNIKLKLRNVVDKDILKCPVFLLLMVLTFAENNDVENHSGTKTDFYKQAFNYVISKYLDKLTSMTVSKIDLFKCTGNEKPCYVALMEKFSHFSLWSILSNRYSFTYNEIVENSMNEPEILKLGLITECVNMKVSHRSSVYEPVHKSLLEFGAAYGLWLAYENGNRQSKLWEENVMKLWSSQNSIMSFSFLLGLMGNNAIIIFTVMMPYKQFYSLKFRNWYCSLLEMEITSDNLKSLSPFLPPIWHIKWDTNDSGFAISEKHKSIVQFGLNQGSIKQIVWVTQHNASIQTAAAFSTLVLHVDNEVRAKLNNLISIQCMHLCLNFHCRLKSSKTRSAFKHILKVLSYKNLSLTCQGDLLGEIFHLLTEIKLNIDSVYWIKVSFFGNITPLFVMLVQLLKSKRVTRLNIEGNCVISFKSCYKLISAAATSQLTAFTFCYNHEPSLPADQLAVDLFALCDRGSKSWQWVQLKGVKVECSSELPRENYIKCLDLPTTCISEEVTRLIQNCHVTSLTCHALLLDSCTDSWPLCSTLTELNIPVDVLIQQGISTLLSKLRRLQILALIMTPNYCITCSVEEWLVGSNKMLTLKGIEIWDSNQNRELATKLVEGIVQCLTNAINIQYLMANNVAITACELKDDSSFILDIINILKQALVENRLPRLDIVPNLFLALNLNTWLPEFPFDEGFRIDYDIWGDRQDDSIKSQMMNDRDHGSEGRISITFQQMP